MNKNKLRRLQNLIISGKRVESQADVALRLRLRTMGDEALYICALTGTTLLRQPSAMDGWHPPDSLLGIKLSFEQAENLFPDVEGIMLGEGRTSEQELITRFAELGKDGIPA